MKTKKLNYNKMFPDKRKEGKSILEKVQIIELRILKIFDYICSKHNLNYFLITGTLLGAIRHKGFIPWDDDVDVIMPREDYEKFVKIVKKELPSDLFWQDVNTDNFTHFRMLFGKIRDNKSKMERKNNYNVGVYLDIFVLEKISTDSRIAIFQKKYLNFLCHLDLLKNNKSFMQQIRIKKFTSKSIFLKKCVQLFSYFMSIFLKKIDIPTIFRTKYYKKINRNSYIYYWYFGKKYFEFTKKDIFPLRKMQFEDSRFNVLNNYHEFLTKFYGNYMKLPPKHLRKPGHIDSKETVV